MSNDDATHKNLIHRDVLAEHKRILAAYQKRFPPK